MRVVSSLLAALSTAHLFATSWALSSSEVGVVDWQKQLIGIPLVNSPAIRPIFHRVQIGTGNTRSVLLTATKSNVLGAVNPANGELSWRYLLEEDDPVVSFMANKDGLALLTGPGGSKIRLLEVLTGNIIWETQLHSPQIGLLMEPPSLGTGLTFARDKTPDVFVLSNAQTVHRLNGLTGEVKWTWSPEEDSSLVLYSKVVTTSSTVYLVGLAKSFASYTLHVTTLDQETGITIDNQGVPSTIVDAMSSVLVLTSAVDPLPRLVWAEKNNLHSVSLPRDLKLGSPIITKGFEKIIDVQLETFGHFIAQTDEGTTSVFRQDGTGKGLRKMWEFSDSKRSSMYSESIYSGGLDKGGLPYISRTYWSHVMKAASTHLFVPHGSAGQGLITGFSFPFDTAQHGVILHGALDVASQSEYSFIGRLAFTTSTGSIQQWAQDQHQWTREESLADIRAVEFVDLPEKLIAASHSIDKPEGFFQRLARHRGDMQNLPAYIIRFSKRFMTGSYTSSSSDFSPKDLWRDGFGFKKLIIAATGTGKVFAIESSRGNIIWGKILSISDTTGAPHFADMKLFVTRTSSDEGQTPELVLVTSTANLKSGPQTVAYHFEALTGKTVGKDQTKGIASPQYNYNGTFSDAYLVPGAQKSVAIVDQNSKMHIYPPSAVPSFAEVAPRLHFSLVSGAPGYRRLHGLKVNPTPESGSKNVFSTFPLWSTNFALGQDVKTVIKPSGGSPIASHGKILGDRSTLYKYLNPHLVAVITAPSAPLVPDSAHHECGVYLVDTVKGSVVYHAPVHIVSRECNIQATLVENWLVYYYYEDDISKAGTAKGHRMVTVELYEGTKADDKSSSSDLSSYSYDHSSVSVHQQAFVFPHGVTALASTATKFGISLKDIIVATDKDQIQAIHRRLLDPRRPKGKPTTQEAEEGLIPFDPLLIDDTRRVLSHSLQTSRIKKIITTPSQLESTSIVFAHGLDLFQTRVAPSKTFDLLSEDFNRLQLVLTITGLAVAILITRPIVQAKTLKAKWYN